MRIAIDTSVLVGLVDAQALWHQQAVLLERALETQHADIAVFDCVLAEALSTIARRIHEQLIASFDQDFDRVAWLRRAAQPEQLNEIHPEA